LAGLKSLMKLNEADGSGDERDEKPLSYIAATGPRPSQPEVTLLLQAMCTGDATAESKLIGVVYKELRRLAASYLRKERRDHTLQATALVHEAYLRLGEQHAPWQNRAQFFGVAAQLMRRILTDYARKRISEKRGGEYVKIPLDEGIFLSHSDSSYLIELDLALAKFARVDGQAAQVFELRFFGGLTVEEAAEVLQIAPRTVNREWAMAQAFLTRELFDH
jgi:RNA polymerase sigma factor (TIGR02999 family)